MRALVGGGLGGLAPAPPEAATATAPALGPARPGWLRGPAFDAGFIGGVFGLALALGALAGASPAAFGAVLFVDFWLLAHPHVGSMYTRLCFDQKSAREHWFLLVGLPPIVIAATVALGWAGGAVALNSAYFYWQSWHYTRQSYGIARAYQRSRGAPPGGRDWATDLVIFAFPAWGVLHRAHQHPDGFYGMPLYCPPVPSAVALAAGAFAVGALGVWAWRELRRLRADAGASPAHALFVLSHVAITVVSYVLVGEITRGWLYVNLWHNAQYLLFVWAFNAKRFGRGLDPERRLLSRLSQPSSWPAYAGLCLGLSTLFYLGLGASTRPLATEALPLVLALHLSVNFHHYLVDAVIWRSPKPARAAAQAA
jgi:hypothetical protein